MIKNQPVRILLVEDNFNDMIFPMESMMDVKPAWCTLTHADRLEDALIRLKEERWDVVLLDLVLPDSMGLNTLQQVRLAVSDVPIIVLTGLDNPKLGIQAIELGASDFLSKRQINARHLVRSVMKALRCKELEQPVCV